MIAVRDLVNLTLVIELLLVDDDDLDRERFQRFVTRQGLSYRVTPAASVAEAVSRLESERFDVAFVDYLLGDGHGTDIVRSAGETPVVIVTGVGNEDIVVTALRAGAHDYVVKDIEGRYLELVPAIIDRVRSRVTAERQAREHAEALDLSNARNAELERFSKILASVLSVPLRSAASYCSLIDQPAADRMIRAYARSARLSVDRAERLVNNLLAYTQIRLDVPLEPVTASRCLSRALDWARVDLDAAEASIEVEELPTVLAQDELLTRAFAQLLENAARNRSPERPLRIRVRAQTTTDECQVRVEDNGVGMTERDRTEVFRPFYTGEGNTEGQDRGTGLGLASCRKIMGLFGGEIWLEAMPEGGTAACMILRLADATPGAS